VAPDGEAVGDGEMVSVQPDGTLSQDLSGLLYTGAQLRELLEEAEAEDPFGDGGEAE